MAVKIRLMRVGKKKQPSYRVSRRRWAQPRDGRFIEIIGQYQPRQDPSVVNIDSDRALHWLGHGAQPTEEVAKLLEITGVWDAYKQATGKDAAAKPKAKTAKAKKSKPGPEAPPAPAPAPAAGAPAEEVAAEAPAEAAPAEEASE